MIDVITGIAIAGSVVTAASAIAAVTPSKGDDKVVNAIQKVINVLALNVGKARNADDPR